MKNAKNWAVKWAVAACMGIAGAAAADNISMTVLSGHGYWDDPTVWGGGVVPTSNDVVDVEGSGARWVYITNGVAAEASWLYLAKKTGETRRGHCVMTGGSLTLGDYLLAAPGSLHTGTFTLSNGTVNIANARIGQSGIGTFTQTGGTVSSPYWIVGQNNGGKGTYDQSGGVATFSTTYALTLGNVAGASGVYKLSGSGVLNVPGVAKIGNAGQGRFEQSGGSLTGGISGTYISLGYGSTGSGVYLMNGGSLDAYSLQVGGAGSGIMTQSLGTVSVTNLYLPYGAGTGTYVLVGGTLSAYNGQNIGSASGSKGTFVQNGGTNICGNVSYLSVGLVNNASGTYEMNGGEIQSSNFLIAGNTDQTNSTGVMTLTGGTITVASEMRVGSYGSGTLLQSGGTVKCPGILYVGMKAGSKGLYLQTGGEARLNEVFVGHATPGTFSNRYVIAGGSATMTNLSVTRGSGSEATFGVVGTNAAVTVVQKLWIAAGGAYEVTLTPQGFAAPDAGTLSLSTEARLKVKFAGPLPYAMDNAEIPILTFGSRNENTFKTVTVDTGTEFGELKSAEAVYYADRITLKVRVSRPPYGTVVTIK